MSRVLVIRLSALGDFVMSFGPFTAIRAHHPDAEITLLTTSPFAELGRLSPWFDRVVVDSRPAWWNLPGLLRLRRELRGFDRIYDLQTSGRSAHYFRLAGRPPWSGIVGGAALPHANPLRRLMHTLERQREQLEAAGITEFPEPALDWLAVGGPDVPKPYVLLVPGAAPHRPRKRWPEDRYGALATTLARRGLTPVVIGGAAEVPLARTICASCPEAIDLTARTGYADLFTLARGAALAIGNDTGPMHLAAVAGCPCLVLFSADSNPALTAPRGPGGTWPTLLRAPDLSTLKLEEVEARAIELMAGNRGGCTGR